MNQLITKGEGVPDFILLDTISEDAVVENLRVRYDKKIIYTYIGNVIVSMNPYANVDIYKAADIENYRGKYMYERPPHVYAIANDAYRSMLQMKENQCVIISGESGAGKTEASKIFMNFIAAVAKGSAKVDAIKERLLKSNPLLESFGNAKTLRNDNSSRFGKYMEIQFERDGSPAGGRITNYLLEKSRIVNRAVGERSFHIFYQLLQGASASDLKDVRLDKDIAKYNYLAVSKCSNVDGVNDSQGWKIVTDAMKILGITEEEKKSIMRLIAAILHLGNLTFVDDSKNANTGQTTVKVANGDELRTTAELLQVDEKILARALTNRSITTGVTKTSSVIEVNLDEQQALFTRDAYAKAIYSRLFDWIVQRINREMACQRPEDKLVIGVLDIYGFEIFQNNSFEQFCINLCNEKLQQVFIELTLKAEQEEYVREGIQWEPVKYFNNKIICDLIEGTKPPGIISFLDEECTLGKATDMTFLDKLNRNFAKNEYFESAATVNNKAKLQYPAGNFKLKHYAGDVGYDVNGFLEKNRDTLFGDLIATSQSSKLKLLKDIFPDEAISKKRPVTAGTQFRTALAELVAKLLSCRPYYIRCIKPNERKAGFIFEEPLVRHQVKYLGLLENVRVRRAGFAYRQEYERFFRRYKMLSKKCWPKWRDTPRAGTELLVKEHNIKDDEFRLGKTKIFIRNPKTLFYFEEAREKALPGVVVKMQAVWRGYRQRRKYNKAKAALRILRAMRWWKANKWFIQVNAAFKNVKTDPQLGKNTPWPQPPPILMDALRNLKKVHATWRAHTMITKFNAGEQAMIRQKVLAYTIFKDKKPYQLTRKYEADYLSGQKNPNHAKFREAIQVLFKQFGDQQILFADEVTKMNRSGHADTRVVIVTEANIYKCDPKNYKVKKYDGTVKGGVPVGEISAVSLSPLPDNFVVLHTKEGMRDIIVGVGSPGVDKLSEFVTILAGLYKSITHHPLPVTFAPNISYNNSSKLGEKSQLTFENDPKVTKAEFKKSKIGGVVHYNPNPGPASPRK